MQRDNAKQMNNNIIFDNLVKCLGLLPKLTLVFFVLEKKIISGGLGCCPFLGGDYVVVYSWFVVAFIL